MTFKVKDLMINVISTGGGGAFLPADDGPIPTPVTPHTPVISAVAITPQFILTAPLIKDALKVQDGHIHCADTLARAAGSDPDGDPAILALVKDIGRAAVGAAVLAHGGGAGMPDPNCGGTSMETIPTPLTPVVHNARTVLSRSHLPALKKQLEQVLVAVEKAELELTPKGRDADAVRSQLEGAIAELKGVAGK